jgi:hypothetical protein
MLEEAIEATRQASELVTEEMAADVVPAGQTTDSTATFQDRSGAFP